MSKETSLELIYGLNDKPPVFECIAAAIQHLLASFVGIVTPALIIGNVLGLQQQLPYIISMSLIASGIGTFVQSYKPFGIGAGMLCVQGTSFAFLGVIVSTGFMVKEAGGGPEEIIAVITGTCFIGSFVQIGLSQFIPRLRRIVTPLVTGIVITSIGISLIKVGITDLAGGFNSPDFGSPANLALGFLVLAVIVLMNISANNWVRLSSIVVGLIVGFLVALATGMLSPDALMLSTKVSLPVPFKYGFDFEITAFIPLAVIYIISSIETTGDITANCIISGQAISGDGYIQRIKKGILGDGINSTIAAAFNSFPNTTFSQNTGVIQLTGIASRHIGLYIAALLIFLGLFQGVGDLLQHIPKPVLGGATLVMFGTIAVAGIKILVTEDIDRRKSIIIAVSFGLGLGLALVPDVFAKAPQLMQNILSSAAATAGLTAIILSIILPEVKEPVKPECTEK